MSDNHYFSHLGCYGDPVVKTPAIDALASQGTRFTRAFCASPSCTPARAALLAGKEIWQLGQGANLWSTLSDTVVTYVDLLKKAGYQVGHDRKGWGPGDFTAGGRDHNPAGKTFADLSTFLAANEHGIPWSYWLSSRNPHRPFDFGAGVAAGIDTGKIVVPPYLPDVGEVRSDMADYYLEIQDFDSEVSEAVSLLKANGQDKNTVIILCGDNGWMMPRGLANLYDFGTRVPLIISWPDHFKTNAIVDDLVSLNDIAPTVLDIAGIEIPGDYSAISLINILSGESRNSDSALREFICFGRERHALCRQDGLGYPGRAIRTNDFLYIENLAPERWPAGDPPLFGDIDLHMLQDKSPTKEFMMAHKDDPAYHSIYVQAFLKRPAEELFDLKTDPYQMNNLAAEATYIEIKTKLKAKLTAYLIKTGDPRALGLPIFWDTQPYYKEADWVGKPRKEAQEKFGLKEKYSYRVRSDE
jgi:arylsulfatase A-like enzyme